MSVLLESRVQGAPLFRRGKVRDVYEAGGDKLVIVASDRLSAFDVVLPTPIPDKGKVLTKLSSFWFGKTEKIVPNHVITTDLRRFPKAFREVRSLAGLIGTDLARDLERLTLELYRFAHDYAASKGLILADTKFEFGFHDGKLIVIDEILTPDSSRYWDALVYRPGGSPASFDKHYVRDFLVQSGWNKEPPAPPLPPEVVRGTSERYRECYRRIVGKAMP